MVKKVLFFFSILTWKIVWQNILNKFFKQFNNFETHCKSYNLQNFILCGWFWWTNKLHHNDRFIHYTGLLFPNTSVWLFHVSYKDKILHFFIHQRKSEIIEFRKGTFEFSLNVCDKFIVKSYLNLQPLV